MKNFGISVFFLVVCTDASRGDGTIHGFLGRYRAEIKELCALYEQARIIAKVTEISEDFNLVYNIELVEKQKSIKNVNNYISGAKRQFEDNDIIIDVASPDNSFALGKSSSDGKLHISFLGQSDSDYNFVHGRIERSCMMVRTIHRFFGIPLEEYLTRKETTIRAIKEENVSGGEMVRIQTYTLPYNEGFRKSGHHADGSFLLDPALHLAIREFDVKYWKKNGKQLWYHLRGRMEYDPKPGSTPTLTHVTYDVLRENEKSITGYRAEVKSISFAEISSEEFTLKGCGVDLEGRSSKWPVFFFWTVGIVAIALALIFILRRHMAKKQQVAR